MKTPYHQTPQASQGNAFTRHLDGGPSIFATKQEIGHQARKLGRMTDKGQANVQASNDRLDVRIKAARAARSTKQQIVYSKAGGGERVR